MIKRYIVAISIMLSLFLAGCSQSHQLTLGEDFGNAVKTNTAMQVIDPEAGREDMPPMALDGQKAEQGLEQYRGETGEADTETLVQDVAR
jgi:type IV pilus biogenesis protein CpaD/CtpE